ncbi:MAG: hypothetical protein ACK5N8_08750 [Alphaproteobacteria bacterium]
MSFNYEIEQHGRVKMAGGSFSTYYDLAAAINGIEKPSAENIISTHKNFRDIRNNPPFDLLLAFYPWQRSGN